MARRHKCFWIDEVHSSTLSTIEIREIVAKHDDCFPLVQFEQPLSFYIPRPTKQLEVPIDGNIPDIHFHSKTIADQVVPSVHFLRRSFEVCNEENVRFAVMMKRIGYLDWKVVNLNLARFGIIRRGEPKSDMRIRLLVRLCLSWNFDDQFY